MTSIIVAPVNDLRYAYCFKYESLALIDHAMTID